MIPSIDAGAGRRGRGQGVVLFVWAWGESIAVVALVTKPFKLIGRGVMDFAKLCEALGFGAMAGTKPFEFVWLGAVDEAGYVIRSFRRLGE